MKAGVTSLKHSIVGPAIKPAAISITIVNSQRTKKINTRLLKKITDDLFSELKLTNAELGIKLVGAKEMARVNWQFLQHEGSTDVITFDHLDSASNIQHPASSLHG